MGPGTILKTFKPENNIGCEGYNCECENLAVYEIQGETDSFGYETMCLCQKCYEAMTCSDHDEKQKYIEENTEMAPDGKVWLCVADYNDGSDWWYTYHKNKAEVEWKKQREDARVGSHGGLYGASIVLVDKERAESVADKWLHRWDDEFDDYESYEDDDDDVNDD